jgi:hypothetical protein
VGFINSSAAAAVAVAVEVPAAAAVVARIPIYKLHAVAVGTILIGMSPDATCQHIM